MGCLLSKNSVGAVEQVPGDKSIEEDAQKQPEVVKLDQAVKQEKSTDGEPLITGGAGDVIGVGGEGNKTSCEANGIEKPLLPAIGSTTTTKSTTAEKTDTTTIAGLPRPLPPLFERSLTRAAFSVSYDLVEGEGEEAGGSMSMKRRRRPTRLLAQLEVSGQRKELTEDDIREKLELAEKRKRANKEKRLARIRSLQHGGVAVRPEVENNDQQLQLPPATVYNTGTGSELGLRESGPAAVAAVEAGVGGVVGGGREDRLDEVDGNERNQQQRAGVLNNLNKSNTELDIDTRTRGGVRESKELTENRASSYQDISDTAPEPNQVESSHDTLPSRDHWKSSGVEVKHSSAEDNSLHVFGNVRLAEEQDDNYDVEDNDDSYNYLLQQTSSTSHDRLQESRHLGSDEAENDVGGRDKLNRENGGSTGESLTAGNADDNKDKENIIDKQNSNFVIREDNREMATSWKMTSTTTTADANKSRNSLDSYKQNGDVDAGNDGGGGHVVSSRLSPTSYDLSVDMSSSSSSRSSEDFYVTRSNERKQQRSH